MNNNQNDAKNPKQGQSGQNQQGQNKEKQGQQQDNQKNQNTNRGCNCGSQKCAC